MIDNFVVTHKQFLENEKMPERNSIAESRGTKNMQGNDVRPRVTIHIYSVWEYISFRIISPHANITGLFLFLMVTLATPNVA